MQRLKGLGVSSGVVTGRALIFRQRTQDVRYYVPAWAVDREVARLREATGASRRQLEHVRSRVARAAGERRASIFDAQLLMLDDPMLVGRAEALVRAERMNVEWACQQAAEEIEAVFDQFEDPYLRERKGDVADVVGRLRLNLRDPAAPAGLPRPEGEGPYVLIADELPPSLAAQVDWTRMAGFATDAGSWTYHTAILARSLHVPAVIGLHDASLRVTPGALVGIDGESGELVIEPERDWLARRKPAVPTGAAEPPAGPLATADGVPVLLDANIDLPDDAARARQYGAARVGLYRSEYLLAKTSLDQLDEDTQVEAYRRLLEDMVPGAVTIRTFDAREHQLYGRAAEGAGISHSRGGLQAIRLSLAERDLFRRQLTALLRAAPYGELRIMFPFISGPTELRQALDVLAEARRGLHARGELAPQVPVGVMIEIPSAALTADLLARDADFFSIGTNDLIQACLAIDRADERVSHLYDPLHPGVLRLIRLIQRVGRRHHRPVSVCGEMAADPMALILLLGLGVTEFSVAPASLPVARRVVAATRVREAAGAVRRLLRGAPVAEVRAALAGPLEAAREAGATTSSLNE